MTREELLTRPEYWFEYEQNELYRQLVDYMEDQNLNQTELAAKLNVSKGYISQVLNGNSNFSLKKLIEFSLSIGKVPKIKYESIDSVLRKDEQYRVNMSFKKGGVIIPISNNIGFTDYQEIYNDVSELPNKDSLGLPA